MRDATDVVGDDDALLEVGETWGYTADAHGHPGRDRLPTAAATGDAASNMATADSNQTGPDTDDAACR